MRKRGAKVIGIDISPKLIQYARTRSEGFDIEYMTHDLSNPLPEELKGKFDLVVSNMVIDDVPDYLGFVSNLSWLTVPNGKVVLSKNNPYSAVIRGKVDNYFESGKAILYKGLASRGVNVYYFHRTLEEYITAFSKAGFCLSRLSDLKPGEALMNTTNLKDSDRYRKYYHFPFLMVIEFKKVN
jgi:2-polyprenyl-3-methyl-5-hydroxy-6-metoxy-1,4-benzoquinol methylase